MESALNTKGASTCKETHVAKEFVTTVIVRISTKLPDDTVTGDVGKDMLNVQEKVYDFVERNLHCPSYGNGCRMPEEPMIDSVEEVGAEVT